MSNAHVCYHSSLQIIDIVYLWSILTCMYRYNFTYIHKQRKLMYMHVHVHAPQVHTYVHTCTYMYTLDSENNSRLAGRVWFGGRSYDHIEALGLPH